MLTKGIPIGKIFGIPLRLDYSWFIIFVLIVWSLTTDYFSATYPHWSFGASIAAGVVTSLLFFGSVLVHELMHSLVAQAAGIPIHSINLFIFGGVSQMEEEPKQPQVELRMALAGPLASMVIGGIFLSIWYWLIDIPEFMKAMCFWLGWINIFLAGFNLIPGFPLDGGRVLRSLLWWHNKNLRKSTRIASNIGRGIGYILIICGIAMMIFGDLVNGLWLAFIGWFLASAAANSYRQLDLQDILKGHKAKEFMTQDCPAIQPEITIQEIVNEQILASGRRCFPVAQYNQFLGLITIDDIKAVPRQQWASKTAAEVMTPFAKIRSVGPEEDLSTVMQILTQQNINQIPVIKEGNIIGMISRDNLLSFIDIRSKLGT